MLSCISLPNASARNGLINIRHLLSIFFIQPVLSINHNYKKYSSEKNLGLLAIEPEAVCVTMPLCYALTHHCATAICVTLQLRLCAMHYLATVLCVNMPLCYAASWLLAMTIFMGNARSKFYFSL